MSHTKNSSRTSTIIKITALVPAAARDAGGRARNADQPAALSRLVNRAYPRAGFKPARSCCSARPVVSAQHPEVGVLEAVVILEAVALEAVEADMGQPHQTQGQDQWPVLPPPKADHHSRQGCGMRCVVGDGPMRVPPRYPAHVRSGSRMRAGTSHHGCRVVE
jgi:hypothetical protein